MLDEANYINYTEKLAKMLRSCVPPKDKSISAAALNAAAAKMIVDEEEHFVSLVARQIGLKTPEGRSQAAADEGERVGR